MKIEIDSSSGAPNIFNFTGNSYIDFEGIEIIDTNHNGFVTIDTTPASSQINIKTKSIDARVVNNQGGLKLESDYIFRFDSLQTGSITAGYVKELNDLRVTQGRCELFIDIMNQGTNQVQIDGGVLYIKNAKMIGESNNAVSTGGVLYLLNCLAETTGIFANILTSGDGNAVFLDNTKLVTPGTFCVDSPVQGFLYCYGGVDGNKPENGPVTPIQNVVGSVSVNAAVVIP